MDSSSNNDENDNSSDSMESPQPHKKRKISSQKSKSIHYLTRSQANNNNNTHKYKRRLRSSKARNSSRNSSNNNNNNTKNRNKNKESLRQKVQPWWIGQRITVQIHTTNKNKNKNQNKTGREATIRDYNPETQLSHIWFETENNHFENVDLLELEDWDVANNKPLHQQIPFVPHNQWIPPPWKIKQRVLVQFDGKYNNGAQFAAFIDGYDPIARRHHINYGDTTEWIWATNKRVEIYKAKCDSYIEEKIKKFTNRDEISAPPWDPTPYGLDETFEIESKKIQQSQMQQNSNNSSHKRQRRKRILKNEHQNNTPRPKVKIFGNKTHPRRVVNSSLIRKNKTRRSVTLDKLLKSTSEKRMTTKARHSRRHSNSSENQEKQASADTAAVLYNNNDSVKSTSSSITATSSSSSSESTFDTKTYQETTDSDDDNTKRRRKRSETTNNVNNNSNSIQVSISNIAKPSKNQQSVKTNISSKKHSKKKKISLRISKKSSAKTSKTNKRNNKKQTQAIPMYLQQIPMTNSINTINTINTNINNTISQPIVFHQTPSNQIPIQSIMPIRSMTNTMPLFIPQKQSLNNHMLPLLQNKNNKNSKKYPRIAIIKGEKWMRHYSKSDRKYYWLLHNNNNDIIGKEWDPWRKHTQIAPWMTSMQKWGKFKDPTERKEYYYNYETKESTFKRPKEFESDQEIQYDSAENN